jgi:hypothetical protein
VFHRQKPAARILAKVVELDQIRMPNVGQRAKFAFQPQHALRIDAEKSLQRDVLTGFSILGEVNLAHAATSEDMDLFVTAVLVSVRIEAKRSCRHG